MVRGNRPRISAPDEDRVITWRLSGHMHNSLIDITRRLKISMNHFISMKMAKVIEDHKKQDTTDTE